MWPVWSPDGSRMVVSGGNPTGAHIYLFDPRDESTNQPREELPPRPDNWAVRTRDWSPDGTRLAGDAFTSDRTQSLGVVVYSFATRHYELVAPGPVLSPAWLADSRRLICSSGGKLLLVDTQTRRIRELLAVPNGIVNAPAITRDNRTIYFQRISVESDIWMAALKK